MAVVAGIGQVVISPCFAKVLVIMLSAMAGNESLRMGIF